jgi:hypothetical protein
MKVFSTSLHFADPKLDGTKGIRIFVGLYFQFLHDLARIKFVADEKLDDHSLLMLHSNERLNVGSRSGQRKRISMRSIRDRNVI